MDASSSSSSSSASSSSSSVSSASSTDSHTYLYSPQGLGSKEKRENWIWRDPRENNHTHHSRDPKLATITERQQVAEPHRMRSSSEGLIVIEPPHSATTPTRHNSAKDYRPASDDARASHRIKRAFSFSSLKSRSQLTERDLKPLPPLPKGLAPRSFPIPETSQPTIVWTPAPWSASSPQEAPLTPPTTFDEPPPRKTRSASVPFIHCQRLSSVAPITPPATPPTELEKRIESAIEDDTTTRRITLPSSRRLQAVMSSHQQEERPKFLDPSTAAAIPPRQRFHINVPVYDAASATWTAHGAAGDRRCSAPAVRTASLRPALMSPVIAMGSARLIRC